METKPVYYEQNNVLLAERRYIMFGKVCIYYWQFLWNVDNPSSYLKPSTYKKYHPFEKYNNFYSLKRELLVIFENNADAKTIPTNKERSSGIVTLQLTPIQ